MQAICPQQAACIKIKERYYGYIGNRVGVAEDYQLLIVSLVTNLMKHVVTRVRHVVESIAVDAPTASAAIEKARKTKRKDWSHLESKKRRGYKAIGIER